MALSGPLWRWMKNIYICPFHVGRLTCGRGSMRKRGREKKKEKKKTCATNCFCPQIERFAIVECHCSVSDAHENKRTHCMCFGAREIIYRRQVMYAKPYAGRCEGVRIIYVKKKNNNNIKTTRPLQCGSTAVTVSRPRIIARYPV